MSVHMNVLCPQISRVGVISHLPPFYTASIRSAIVIFEGLHRAESVAHICSKLQKKKGWIPDCVLAHSGWGETLAISEVFPDTPQ